MSKDSVNVETYINKIRELDEKDSSDIDEVSEGLRKTTYVRNSQITYPKASESLASEPVRSSIDKIGNSDQLNVSVVWIFATTDEREATFDALNLNKEERETVYNDYRENYCFLYVIHSIGNRTVAFITQDFMGIAAAVSLVTRAIIAFSPDLVVMSGICAGREDKVHTGDVIVASQTYDYGAGKLLPSGFEPRPLSISCSNTIETIVNNYIIGKNYLDKQILDRWTGGSLGRNSVTYLKAIASGAYVVDDNKTIKNAAKVQGDLFGIDMESYGVAEGARPFEIDWVVVKGVQDFGNGHKEVDERISRQFAAFASAIVAEKIVIEY